MITYKFTSGDTTLMSFKIEENNEKKMQEMHNIFIEGLELMYLQIQKKFYPDMDRHYKKYLQQTLDEGI